MVAARTGLRRIGGRNKYHWYTSNIRLVVNKQPELIKRPIVRSTSLGFTARLLVETVSNSCQVLKSQCSITAFRFLYQLLRNVVIEPFLKATFSAREPAEQSTTVPAAFALNVRSNPAKSVSNGLNLLTIPGLTRRSGSNISSSQIHTNYFRCLARWRSVNLNNKVDVIIALFGLAQCCTGEVLPSKQCNLIPTNRKPKVNSSTLEGHSYNLLGLHIFKGADIQTDRSGSEFVDLFNSFGVTNHPSNGLADVICFQSCSFPDWLINLVVKLSRIPAIVTFSHCQYLIASISKSPQSFIELWLILRRNYKLALHRQGLSHRYIVTHPACRRLKSHFRFLRGLKPHGFHVLGVHNERWYSNPTPRGSESHCCW